METTYDADRCPFCGGRTLVAIAEIYTDGHFDIDTCCGAMHEFVCEQTEDWRGQLQALGIEELTGHRLRRVLSEPDGLLADYALAIRPVKLAEAKAFVRRFHAHNPAPPAGWKFGASIFNGPQLLGVVIIGRPVARRIDAAATVEVTRLCLRRDIAAGLRWNAASMLYGWAAKEARRRRFASIITYTLKDLEPGTSLIAAGWKRDGESRGGSWSRPSRPRIDKASLGPKVRWRKQLGLPRQKKAAVVAHTSHPGGEQSPGQPPHV